MIPSKSNSGATAAFQKVMGDIRSVITENLSILPENSKVSKIGVSVESYSDDEQNLFQNAGEALRNGFKTVSQEAFSLADNMDSARTHGENLGSLEYTSRADKEWMSKRQHTVSVEAATILGMAHHGVKTYESINPGDFDKDCRINPMITSGAAGSIACTTARPSMESFDETETEKWRDFSYAVAMMAAKTHPFAELFYPLYVATPENAAWVMSIRRTMVWDGFRQEGLTGEAVDMLKRNALEALLDYKLLETETTRLYPVVREENKSFFVDPNKIAPQDKTQGQDKFKTNYIKFDDKNQFNLINLCQTPSRLAKGAPNFTDSLDRRVALDKVVIALGKTDPEYIELDLNRDTYAQFLAPREYNFRQMTLKFEPQNGIALRDSVRTVTGAPSAKLKALFDKKIGITFDIIINGDINVESSNGKVYAAGVAFRNCFDLNDPSIVYDLEDSAVAALIPDDIQAYGFTLEARLTNLNQLERGKLVDSDVMKEGFVIPTLSPVCIVKPDSMADDKVYPKVESLQFVYRTQLRNDAVTALLNRAEILETALGNGVTHPLESNKGLEGLSQYYVRPRFDRIVINVKDELNSITSSKKMSDIQSLIVSRINEILYRVNRETGYSAALEEQFPGATPKPHVAIGTDTYLPQFLMIPGDDRTTGIGFDHTIASISDLRMRNTIVMQFTLPGEKEPHPMQSGICGMVPEFLVNFQMIRDQRVANEIRLTPRYRYFNLATNMIVVEVNQLEEAVAERIAVDMNAKTVAKFPSEDAVVPTPGE